MTLHTFHSEKDFIDASVALMVEACQKQPSVRLALSGGTTPAPIYKAFALHPYLSPTLHIHSFEVDERYVLPDSPDSNRKLIQDHFITPLEKRLVTARPRLTSSFFDTTLPLEQALQDYEKIVQDTITDYTFDLAILGMGPDGHTAGLFPHSVALREATRLTAHTTTHQFAVRDRLTLTFPALMKSKQLLLLLRGKNKASILHDLLHKECGVDELPAKKLLEHSALTIHFLAA